MKELLSGGLLHGDCLTITGRTVAENLANIPKLADLNQVSSQQTALVNETILQKVIYPLSNPVSPAGHHIIVLKGSLSPDSAVLKLSGKEFSKPFSGPVSCVSVGCIACIYLCRPGCLMVKMEHMML